MNIFDRNRNELSRYFYDLSKGIILSLIVIPVIQDKFRLETAIASALTAVILLIMAMLIKKESRP